MLDYTHTIPVSTIRSHVCIPFSGWQISAMTICEFPPTVEWLECWKKNCGIFEDGIIYPPSVAQGHVFCQTESNISNPQNNSNLKQLDRDDRNVCQPSRGLCPLPYNSVDLQHIYNRRLLVHLQHLLHLAVWRQQHLADTSRITSCTIVSKI